MIRNHRLWITIGLYVALAAWLFLTNPQKLPIIFLMVPFVLLFAALWLTANLFLNRFFPKLRKPRRVAAALCISGVPVFLLILGSVNQLTWRDVVLVVCLVVFLFFYSGRLHFSES